MTTTTKNQTDFLNIALVLKRIFLKILTLSQRGVPVQAVKENTRRMNYLINMADWLKINQYQTVSSNR